MQVVFQNIEKRYGDFYAVRDLNLTIKKGALHFLLGPSGCGKTTTLRMLAGLETPTGGKLFFNERDVTNVAAADRGIGMVFQNYALWPHMTVRQNIEYGLKLRRIGDGETKRRVDEVLEITQLVRFVERYPGQLSGGQQQRVALARALAIRPNVLLLDEPLSNLDAKLRLEMRDNITRIHRETGITTVYVTHDQKESLSMGTMISVMHAGLLKQTGTPRDMYNFPETPFIAGFIGETNLIPGTYRGQQGQRHEVETAVGTLFADSSAKSFNPGDAVVLSLRPEAMRVQFRSTPSEHLNLVPLKLSHLTYLGESEQWHLEGQGGLILKSNVVHAPDHGLHSGDTVKVAFPAEDLRVLPQEELGRGT